jgi:serine/threonine protein kinase
MASISADAGAAPEPHSAPGCPSDDDLLAFIPGLLADEDAAVVLAHLQSCPTCQSRVTTLKKRLSTEHGHASAAPQSGNQSPAGVARQRLGNSSDPTAATLAYTPKRQLPKALGNYQLLRPIGRGGMGVVFKAYHPRLQRYYAIKLLQGLHLGDDTAIVRLQREMAAAGRVEHENIVYSSDAGSQDGIDYLVMEFVDGVDLGRLVATIGPLPIADACEITRQAALGLAHVESCGLVHRDIKPSNLMLSTEGVVKILDLGLARLREGPIDQAEATHSGFLLGTADYIAPEQIDTPRAADVRSDLYSLGCTLYKLLSGNAPFSGEVSNSVMKKVEAHRSLPPPPVSDGRPEIPEALTQIVSRLLTKNPADRFQHPRELVAALTPFCVGSDLAGLLHGCKANVEADLPLPPDTSQDRSVTTERAANEKLVPASSGAAPAPADWTRRLGIPALCTIALLVFVGVIWWRGGLSASVPPAPGSDPPFKLVPNGLLSKKLEESGEYKWIGHRGANHVNVSNDLQFLHVDSDTPQIIVLGKSSGGRGKFKVTINQIDKKWEGYAGIALGVRDELVETPRGVQKLMTVFQLISLHRRSGRGGKGVVEDGVNVGYGMEVKRHKVYIDPETTNDLDMEVKQEPWVLTAYEDVPFPGLSAVEMELEFGEVGIDAIRWNGVPLSELTSPRVNSWFEAKDYVGPCGLYNKGHRGTTFSNIEASSLKPLE